MFKDTDKIVIRAAKEGGFVVTVPSDRPGYKARVIVALSTVEDLMNWLEISIAENETTTGGTIFKVAA